MKFDKLIALGFLLLTFSSQTSAMPDRQEKTLMNRIVRQCSEMKLLTFPRPDTNIDRGLEDYQKNLRWFKRDLSSLKRLNANAEQSQYKIQGSPFKDYVAHCKNIIDKNEHQLASQPSHDAVKHIDEALSHCLIGQQVLKSYQRYTKALDGYYKRYKRDYNKAVSADKRIIKQRQKDIDTCLSNFVTPYLAVKSKHDKVVAENIRQEKKRAEEHEKAVEAYIQKENARAKELGYISVSRGINQLIDQLNKGAITVRKAKKYIYEQNTQDSFSVSSLVGDYAIYNSNESYSTRKIALVRSEGQFYGEGSSFKEGYYALIGVKEFVTVTGAKKQVLIFKEIKF